MKKILILLFAIVLLIAATQIIKQNNQTNNQTNNPINNPIIEKYSKYNYKLNGNFTTGPKRICGGLFCCSL